MIVKSRCRWAVENPELIDYHDHHWGKPQHHDQQIFAAYAQCILHAGLNWLAFLKKRAVFAAAFSNWDVPAIAAYNDDDIERLMTAGPVRNLQKVRAIIHNAQCFGVVQSEYGSFDHYVWGFVGGEPIVCDHVSNPGTQPARELAADLKKRGFQFVGEATTLGLMQDIGMINDHDQTCFCYPGRASVDGAID